ncbi:MAG: ATP-binding protein [Acidimicrobiales bacterium]
MARTSRFVGRQRDLERLQHHLDVAVSDGRGRLLSVRGRRQAGKSRLVTEFADGSALPQFYFTGNRLESGAEALVRLGVEASRSTLPGAHLFEGVTLENWSGALRQIASALPNGPAIVVLDEFPWLAQPSPELEGALQAAWDRIFESRPVLFILIGSDVAMMEALTAHDRPLFGRAKEVVVNPFTVADTAAMIGVDAADVVIDAQLITGGYPRLCLEWRGAEDAMTFLRAQIADENSDLVVVGRNVLAAEFPTEMQARHVLTAIGAGDRTNKAIAARAGLQAAPLARSLHVLRDAKRVVAADLPVSTRPAREPRYRIADSYLRFWLRFIEPRLPDIARGRSDLALARIREAWIDYRGRAVEPLVRESIERLATDDPRLEGVSVVGGYWTRTGDVEVDLVGVERWPDARRVVVIGSVKWRERSPFNRRDRAALAVHRGKVPGGRDAALVGREPVGVQRARCRCGVRPRGPRGRLALTGSRVRSNPEREELRIRRSSKSRVLLIAVGGREAVWTSADAEKQRGRRLTSAAGTVSASSELLVEPQRHRNSSPQPGRFANGGRSGRRQASAS